jgi:hypothetical protein
MFEPGIPRTEELDTQLEEAGIETLDYDTRWKKYRIRVTDKDLKSHEDLFRSLIEQARNHREG